MNDCIHLSIPAKLAQIELKTKELGFGMASDYLTGSLLRTLVATKPAGSILELGTGTGLSTCWLLEGMGDDARLLTVDNDPKVIAVAQEALSGDSRVTFSIEDGSRFLEDLEGKNFDFIFADTWPGKYWDFDKALGLLKPGGIYIVDDMSPQENWPEGHAEKAEQLIKDLEAISGFRMTKLNWSTGIIVMTKM